MRTFNDTQGQRWQAALLEGSYGTILLIFNPFEGDGISQVQMDANTMEEAGEQLRGFDEGRLCELLAQARPWEQSMGVFSNPVAGN